MKSLQILRVENPDHKEAYLISAKKPSWVNTWGNPLFSSFPALSLTWGDFQRKKSRSSFKAQQVEREEKINRANITNFPLLQRLQESKWKKIFFVAFFRKTRIDKKREQIVTSQTIMRNGWNFTLISIPLSFASLTSHLSIRPDSLLHFFEMRELRLEHWCTVLNWKIANPFFYKTNFFHMPK